VHRAGGLFVRYLRFDWVVRGLLWGERWELVEGGVHRGESSKERCPFGGQRGALLGGLLCLLRHERLLFGDPRLLRLLHHECLPFGG